MFYSQCLLSRKGPLGTIWVAAHCLKRVKKTQISQTNISSSVDKILLDEVPVVSYRVLGFLLLGVVRIYSKKVEFMFDDCRKVLVKINAFTDRKKANLTIEAICAPYLSITRPVSFELDAYDLQILEDGRGVNIRPDEDIMLGDARRNEGTEHCLFDKHNYEKDCNMEHNYEEDVDHFETCSTAYTPVKDVLSPYIMGNIVVASPSHNLSNSEASIEKIRGYDFSLGERMDPMPFGEGEEEPGLDRPFGEAHQTDIEQIKYPNTGTVIGAQEEPPDSVRSLDEEQHMDVEQIRFSEMVSAESERCQITTKDRPVSITIDVTPQSKCLNTSGATTPEFMAVQTPAPRERTRVSRKRKCLLDDIIMLPNKALKDSIDNSSDLVCKRRKVPHTALHAWKAHQISNLPHTFLEPLIPCKSLELKSLFYKMKLKSPEAVETVDATKKIGNIGSPTVHRPLDETDIAPSTPGTRSTSMRLHEAQEFTNFDGVRPARSFESMEKELSRSDDKEFDISLLNEEVNTCGGDNQEMSAWSVRTRIVAKYLCRSFLNRKKRKEDKVANLSHVLKRKTRTESARVFYEILVLKSGDYIDVNQDEPYGDVLVMKTPKLKQSLKVMK
ncbi:sister chromatid cohesion 1 protein 2 [Actinidia eriantha]|uniref:sister chromatid cohesion 1 protein 2 n=1 Tax=Actinidia eriantha TaxID=165200 RepID=UPI002587E6CB|nr:sister chromatid cohesion 1 protein 2 [Actinidia eriantha]